MSEEVSQLKLNAKQIRKLILEATTTAGSGHPSSSLSATDLMTAIFFGGYFLTDLKNPQAATNDRLIFSKGHASPLLYSLYTQAGAVSKEELLTLRQFNSVLEGHPTMQFKYTEAATGSLGQGLGIGVGMAMSAKMNADARKFNTWVLMGDSEMAEGSVWEAMQIASHYKLNNLIGIVDVNRLGQTGETMLGHNIDEIAQRCVSFGWEVFVVDGHNMAEIVEMLEALTKDSDPEMPKMIVAQTIKGKGVSFMENKDGWHGKALNPEELKMALAEL